MSRTLLKSAFFTILAIIHFASAATLLETRGPGDDGPGPKMKIEDDDSGLSAGVIAGIVVGTLAAVAIAASLLCCLRRRNAMRKSELYEVDIVPAYEGQARDHSYFNEPKARAASSHHDTLQDAQGQGSSGCSEGNVHGERTVSPHPVVHDNDSSADVPPGDPPSNAGRALPATASSASTSSPTDNLTGEMVAFQTHLKENMRHEGITMDHIDAPPEYQAVGE